jgi:hypothetical protein
LFQEDLTMNVRDFLRHLPPRAPEKGNSTPRNRRLTSSQDNLENEGRGVEDRAYVVGDLAIGSRSDDVFV